MPFLRAYFQIHMNSTRDRKVTTEVNGQVINSTAVDSSILRTVHITKGALEEEKQQFKVDISSIMAVFTKEIYRITKLMDKELTMILSKIMNILGVGKKISHMVEDDKNLEMDHIMKDSFVTE